MASLFVDMNRLKPLPTVAREVRAFAANVAFVAVVVAGFWLFEGPVLLVGVVGAAVLVLLAGRLAWRVARGDSPAEADGPVAGRP